MPQRKMQRVPPGRRGIERLVAKRSPSVFGIRRLMREVHGFLTPVSMEGRTFKRATAMRMLFERNRDMGAEELAAKRKIFVPGRKNGPMPMGKKRISPIWGCHSECLVMYEALRELGKKRGIDLKPELVRKVYYLKEDNKTLRRPHTEVLFELEGRKYVADPFNQTLMPAKREDLAAPRIKPEPISRKKYFEEMNRENVEEEFPLGVGGNP